MATNDEIVQQAQALKERLAGTDYIAIKASEGCDVSE